MSHIQVNLNLVPKFPVTHSIVKWSDGVVEIFQSNPKLLI